MAIFKDSESKQDIFDLVDKFDKSSLAELEITISHNKVTSENETRIKMMKAAGGKINYMNRGAGEDSDVGSPDETALKISKESEKPADDTKTVKAPLVGTFYSSPSPDSEPYVKVGDKVTRGMVICIIEAMKTMNEIESEFDGEVVEILADNNSPVEYGQPLFRVE